MLLITDGLYAGVPSTFASHEKSVTIMREGPRSLLLTRTLVLHLDKPSHRVRRSRAVHVVTYRANPRFAVQAHCDYSVLTAKI